MSFDWQTIATLVVVAAAIGYLSRSAWQILARRKAAACGGCDSCPTAAGGETPQVVQIDSLGVNGKMAGHAAGSHRDATGR